MNRRTMVVLSMTLQLLVLQFLIACNALPSQPPAVIPTAIAPAATATAVPPTNTPKPTAAPPTTQPTARPAALQIALQAPDNSIKVYGLDGSSSVLTQASVHLAPLNRNTAANALGDTIYAYSFEGTPAPVLTVDASGVHPVAALKNNLTGEAVAAGHLAWGSVVISGTVATAELFIGGPDGSQATATGSSVARIAKKTMTADQPPHAYEPLQFSKDGTRLYFSLEPQGLGGYILFGGASNLSSYSLSDGKTTELIQDKQLGSLCIDGVSPNDQLVAHHCVDKSIGVFDLATKKSSIIQLPADLTEVKVLGEARFNPDSTRVAFAAARRDPENEQGWILVSDGLSGKSMVIAKSAAKDYDELITWLNADTLLLQSHNPQPAVWTVKADGSGLQKLGDGLFLSVLPARP